MWDWHHYWFNIALNVLADVVRTEKERKEMRMGGKILNIIIETDKLLGLIRESNKVANTRPKYKTS